MLKHSATYTPLKVWKIRLFFKPLVLFCKLSCKEKPEKNIKIRHFFHTKQETFSILLMDFWQEEKKKKKIAYLSKPPFCHQAQSSSHNVLLLGIWMNVLSKVKITHCSILSIFFKSVHFSQFNLVFFFSDYNSLN